MRWREGTIEVNDGRLCRVSLPFATRTLGAVFCRFHGGRGGKSLNSKRADLIQHQPIDQERCVFRMERRAAGCYEVGIYENRAICLVGQKLCGQRWSFRRH